MCERKNDILKVCQSAGYTEWDLIYGGFVNGKHYVSYGQDDAEELQDVGATPAFFEQVGILLVG